MLSVIHIIMENKKEGKMNPGEPTTLSHQLLRILSDTSLYIFYYQSTRTGKKSSCKGLHVRSNTSHFYIRKQFLILPEINNVFILAKCKIATHYLCSHPNKKPFYQSKTL